MLVQILWQRLPSEPATDYSDENPIVVAAHDFRVQTDLLSVFNAEYSNLCKPPCFESTFGIFNTLLANALTFADACGKQFIVP